VVAYFQGGTSESKGTKKMLRSTINGTAICAGEVELCVGVQHIRME